MRVHASGRNVMPLFQSVASCDDEDKSRLGRRAVGQADRNSDEWYTA